MSSLAPITPPPILDYETPVLPPVNLRHIAWRQRVLTWAMILYFSSVMAVVILWVTGLRPGISGPGMLTMTALVFAGSMGLHSCVCACRLCVAIYSGTAAVMMVIFIIGTIGAPYVGIIPLALVRNRAGKMLRSHGLEVGFIGADMRQIPMD